MSTQEQALRREAIRRRLNGERRKEICHDLERSIFQRDPHTEFCDRSRAPVRVARTLPPEIEPLVVTLRHHFEAAPYGLIGARAIQGKLRELKVHPLPSETTIQRLLARQGLTHPVGAATSGAYYPWLPLADLNAVQATDIISKHLWGGLEIQNFHTLDLATHTAVLSQHLDKTATTTCRHLLRAWTRLGLPLIHQFDNEGAFCGGHTHPRVIGRVVRLCLWCGVEAFFTPLYDPKRNHQIETFHALWCRAFWSRQTFTSLPHVRRAVRSFLHWYHSHYRPPALAGKTPAQSRAGHRGARLTPDLRRLLPDVATTRIPLTAGRFHLMRKVDAGGYVEFLNERWLVGRQWTGEYIRATVDTARQTLTLSYKASETADWQLLKTRVFRLTESVHDLLPQFKRNRARCCAYLPG
jgi:transposase InsO family protein